MNKIYFVSTPIGNLKDITFRAIETLEGSDIIAAEDPKKSSILLNHYNIKKKVIKYNEGNKEKAVKKIIDLVRKGKTLSYISEAGSPSISDPGYLLVRKALKYKMKVIPIPGPTAITTALMVSGIPSNQFIFMGFLPKKNSSIEKFLYTIKTYNLPVVIYVSPHKFSTFLNMYEKILNNRYLVIARELTKKYEEITRGFIDDIKNKVEKNIKGEFTLIIDKSRINCNSIETNELIEKGRKLLNDYSISETSKILSKLYAFKRRKIYDLLHKFLKN
ncbi:MAG: 16S rRNA (cytidine(1402)-2'-O)-methyltransferase [Candidatus Mcinerneyibacterium aminivorans]|jgi:16S rRNA (cytidine1402-2'-O)-methyltransferase|uniref:Ribosomal RNA small subunit methyltransferase I n=1 Tax=Candidatus Mcinerneyibacterium aminivorans TaxID=2703815 RepID=A0A5D0MIH0_9BACT|nr:MAG: 16S rRNA (cytidine(1402)-2'-O)-methyltransferase [Candidatus Mcinerneyibacterium aminivorans]